MPDQVNIGLDPEIVQAGIQLAGYHIEAGARSFIDFSKAMIKDLGDIVKPYLRGWYETARYYPNFDSDGMTQAKDIDNIDIKGLTTEEKSSSIETERGG